MGKDAKDQPVELKRASVRVFLTDMIGNADPEKVGPKAFQFKCPGGTFETFGDYGPYVSHNVGDYIAIEDSFTINGQISAPTSVPTRTLSPCGPGARSSCLTLPSNSSWSPPPCS